MAARTAKNEALAPSEDEAAEGDEVTRCICGNQEFVSTPRTRAMGANPGLYVQCERCHVWQHGFCMGFSTEEAVPDMYYCEQCMPSYHRIQHRHGIIISRYQPKPYGALGKAENSENASAPSKPPISLPSSASSDASLGRHSTSASRGSQHNGDSQKGAPTPKVNGKTGSHRDRDRENHHSIWNGRRSRDDATTNEVKREIVSSKDGSAEEDSVNGSGSSITTESRARKTKARNSDVPAGPVEEQRPANGAAEPRKTQPVATRRLDENIRTEQTTHGSTQSRQVSRDGIDAVDTAAASAEEAESSPLDAKKRRRKPSATYPASTFGRGGRNRRSREEEILQRVLEESAREAREAEARRRGDDSFEANGEASAEATDSEPGAHSKGLPSDEENDAPAEENDKRQRGRTSSAGKRGRVPLSVDEGADDNKKRRQDSPRDSSTRESSRLARSGGETPSVKDGGNDGPPVVRSPRQRATRGNPGRPRSSGTNGGNSRMESPQMRTLSGAKKCKPRIPSPRSTLQEMRRRVGWLLEVAGRTQADLASEKDQVPDNLDQFSTHLERLAEQRSGNLVHLEALTRKLLQWEERFGQKSP